MCHPLPPLPSPPTPLTTITCKPRACRCGDLYGDKAVDTFNACAVSDEKCVPQRADEGLFPVPPDCALDKGFDIKGFSGRWYITAGLNPLFDIFDCQVGTGFTQMLQWDVAEGQQHMELGGCSRSGMHRMCDKGRAC
jgi:hypothetical protein